MKPSSKPPVGYDRQVGTLLRSSIRARPLVQIIQQGQTNGNAVAPKETDYAYNAIGDVTARAGFNFIGIGPRYDIASEAISYNSLGLLDDIQMTSHAGQVVLDNLTYSYDTLARVSTFGSIDGSVSYGYDPTSQLTSASYTAASGHTEPPNLLLSFDKNGNKTSIDGTSTTVGGDNHLTNDGTFTFAYDAAGNLVTRTRISTGPGEVGDYRTTYSWDYRDRLTDVDFYNNNGILTQHVHYVYDVWDDLIERDLDPNGSGTYTQIVHYVWDGDNVVLAFNGSGQLTARYLNGPNTSAYDQYYTPLVEEDVTSLTSAGTLTFDLQDSQGSVTDVAGENGNLADHIQYNATGGVFSESNPSVLHIASFQGGYLDPVTGLEKFGARWEYMADAFWASQDPLGFGGGDTNLTRAVGNSAPNYLDPSGLDYIKEVQIDEHTTQLIYVDEGFMGKDRPGVYIGVMDPTDPERKVTRHGMTVFYQDVYDEVHDWGSTTDDWEAWFQKKKVDFNAANCKNMAVEYGSEYLTPKQQQQITRGKRRDRVEQMQGFAKDGVTNAAMAGAAVTRAPAGACSVVRSASKMGRAGKQARLRELAKDASIGSAERGWIQQELNSISRGQRSKIRVPPGKNLAHRRGYEAKKGYSYEYSDLQDKSLHDLQHKHEGY